MRYIKTYEALTQKEKEDFIKYANEPYKTFSIDQLKKDCRDYGVIFINLLREIMLHREISFRCYWCYDDNMKDYVVFQNKPLIITHNIIGLCTDIKHEDERELHSGGDWDSDVLVKIEDMENWHTLYNYDPKNKKEKRVRVFNYTEGPLMQEIEVMKNVEKYNL